MDVLGDVIGRERRSEATALRAPAVGREYDYRRFCTSAWKTGNFLRHLGVRSGAGVDIANDPLPEPVITFYGAAMLGAVVRFGPSAAVSDDTRALVVPAADIDTYTVGPSTKRVVYGDRPDDPDVSYFERDVWSENPTEPPDRIDAEDPLLATPSATYTHGELLDAANEIVESHDFGPTTEVAVRGSFTDASMVVGGLVAPIVAGGAIVVGPETTGDIVAGGPDSDIDVKL